MDKHKYYVSVQARSILREQGQAAYEWEIEATDDDAAKLQTLFEELEEADHATLGRIMTPGLPYHHDPQNDEFDRLLQECYDLIHRLGVGETKSQLETLGDLRMGHYQEE